jgi:tetratricopeptide (TPR) repeat protein
MGTRKAPGHEALEHFEKAMKALGKHDFERALEHFDVAIGSPEAEREVVERARAYRALCVRSLDRKPARLRGFEDLLHMGVMLHNRGEHTEAIKLLRQALELQPRNEHALYCVAAAAARSGDADAACHALRQAIEVSPGNRTQARMDPDFDDLREHHAFSALLQARA